MTRANTEQIKHTPWFAKAGAACSIVPISRFVGPNIFALKGGGYGCLFSLSGLDEEALTDLELEARVRQVEGALRGLPEGSCLYQYTRVMSGFDLPRQKQYSNEVTETFASDRLTHLDKTAAFRRIDLRWCVTLEPSQAKAFRRKPDENAADTSRMLSDLEKTATLLEGHLGNSLGLKLLGKAEAFQFFSYLFNLEEWSGRDQLRADTGVDRQIVKSPVAWHSDHVQIGKRHVQMFSLKTTPEASRPCLFSGLLTLDCDSVLCSTWRVKSTSAARSEIDAQEKFISFFKVGVLTRVMSGRDTASLDSGAGAKAANKSVDDLSEVIRSLDKKAQGEFSLRLLLATRSPEQLRDTVPTVHRIFVDARAQVMEETLGNLSAFYAMFPGNHKFNVFPLWLAEDHHARLSSVFAPHIGHPHSEDLDSEYLNIFETRTRTPFFQDVYVDGVRVMLIIGPTGTGKTASLETIREGAEAKGYKVEGLAPTSRAAGQLREAGIEARTLQSFLARKAEDTPGQRHLYMLDESSLASSKQMRDFLQRVSSDDRVLVIGDVRQHQGVEAGKPFEQMQQAGMQTSQLDQIMRQKDAELLKAVQHLATGETEKGVELLAQQGRVTEVKNSVARIAAIAKDYAAQPENTIVVSPDNRSRQQINEAIRAELQSTGQLSPHSREFQTLAHRSDLTGAGRTWAALYNPCDVIHYESGSNALGFGRDSEVRVVSVDARTNTLTVQKQDGEQVSYDPKRLYGVNVFEERSRDFSLGERVQFTAGNRDLGIANRDLGTITALAEHSIRVRVDAKSGREVTFDPTEFRQLDHGYAVTSHSSQGLTADRVIANIDTDSSRSLINDRLAYVAISRAAYDARIYTNSAATLGERLATDVSKSAALELEDVRQAADSFRRDDPHSATMLLRDTNRIHVYSDPEHRLAAVAQDYLSKEDRAVIFAADKTERQELTRLIRADLHEQGRLGETFTANVLIDKVLSDKDSKIAANYEVGDVIRYGSKGSDELGISPNTYRTVTGVDAEKNLITVTGADDSPRVYNPATEWQMRLKATIYSSEDREFAEGERIQFTRSEWDQGIRVGNLATIAHIHEDGGLSVKVDSGAILQRTPEQAQHVEYGYAIESTKRLAVDRVILSGESEQISAQREALSQLPAKLHELTVYTSDGYHPAAPDLPVQKEFVGTFLTGIPTTEIDVPSIDFEGYAIEM